jgi:hypothetical protein
MEKEFVPYKQALALKELGFDESCIAIYSNANPKTGYYTLKKYRLKLIKQASQKDKGVKAPLYQQAFRWFREKYGYLHHITYFDPVKAQIPGEADYQGFVLFPHQDIHKLPKSSYDTYEEVELACLEKLIEIAESNGKEEVL